MRNLYVIFILFYWIDGFAQNASELFSYDEYVNIKKTMFSDYGKCDAEKVLASGKALGVSSYYYKFGDGSSPGYLLKKMKRPGLCMISISTDVSFVGPNKSPKGKYPDYDVYRSFPKGEAVEEIIFMPPMKLRKLCDDNGIPPIRIIFKKKQGRLERVIAFDPDLVDCALGVAEKIK